MGSALFNFFVPPPQNAYEVRRLSDLLSLLFSVQTVAWVAILIFNLDPLSIRGIAPLLSVGHGMTCLWLVRSGSFTFARVTAPFVWIATLAWLAASGSGVHDTSMAGFPLVIVVTALVLNRASALFIVIFALMAIAGLVHSEQVGWIQTAYTDKTDMSDLVAHAIILMTTLLALWKLMTHTEGDLARARDSQKEAQVAVDILRVRTQELEEQRNALISSEENNRLLSESVHDLIWTMDMKMQMTTATPSVEALLGYTREEFLTLDQSKIIDRASRIRIIKILREEMANEGQGINPNRSHTFEIQVKKKNGTYIPAEVHAAFVRDEQGVAIGIIGTTRNISERKKGEEEKAALQLQLARSRRLESVGQLAGGVAHDFNNLLVAIGGYTGLVLNGNKLSEDDRKRLEQVALATQRATTLTRQLLSFGRRQIIDLTPVDLNVLFEDLQKMLFQLIPENIQPEFTPGHDLGTVMGDVGQLEQVLVNLCVNARDAMPDGGTLSIGTENIHIEPAYIASHPWARPGEFAMLRVADTGVGMSQETIDQVFEPFFTTKAEGTGLGLSVVFGVIEQHDGFIHVSSEPEAGSEFRIYLPIVERPAVGLSRVEMSPVDGGNETILLVEDNEQVRELAVDILGEGGYSVITAAEGESALRQYSQNEESIDLVLLDVVMPKMGGREVMESLRASGSSVPILFSSGYASGGIHTDFMLEEGLDLLPKPYGADDLLRKVREVLDRNAKHTN